ncbi:MAG: hypothetical protein WC785_02225 [Tatlockia sp.]|jgi:hypothetical protein
MKSTTPTLESLLAIIEAQAETIKQLQAKIADLEKSRNKNGGQLGHKRETLKQVAFPDAVITPPITHYPDCGKEINLFLNYPHPPFGHLLPPAGEGA